MWRIRLLGIFLFILFLVACSGEPIIKDGVSVQAIPQGDYGGVLTEVGPGQWEFTPVLTFDKSLLTQAERATLVQNKNKEPLGNLKPERLHKKLKDKIQKDLAKNPNEKVTVIITYEDSLSIPRFFDKDPNEAPSSPVNVAVEQANQKIVEKIKLDRKDSYTKVKDKLKVNEAEVLNEFWLLNAVVANVPLKSLDKILLDQSVIFIEPDIDGSPPPAFDSVADGRARIASDPYFGYSVGGQIALLDTGVRSSHTLLAGRLNRVYDCTFRVFFFGPYCGTNGGPEDDPLCNHGTSTAAIMSGNNNLGNAYRGVTQIVINSYRVYSHTSSCGLDTAAALAAFQQAVSDGNSVIVAEMQATGDYNSSISVAADNAYDSGRVVIAATGNFGTDDRTGAVIPGSVRSPANAHKVIGVGAVDVDTLTYMSYTGRGPTNDGRVKPDITAPTNTLTASALGNTATRFYLGTSGATPFAAGAAVLMRSRWYSLGFTDPGHTYASLINGGQNTGSAVYDNDSGAGLIKVSPPYSMVSWSAGKVTINNGQTLDISFGTTSIAIRNVDCAIWWPEGRSSHSDIDLTLISPTNQFLDSSVSVNSVFEKVNSRSTPYTGAFRARVHGLNVRAGGQVVYYDCKIGS